MSKSRPRLLPPTLLAGLAMAPLALAGDGLVQVREDFSRDPGWEGRNNSAGTGRGVEVVQDFGHARSAHAGGKERGEIGGRVQRSLTPASYAAVIAERTLDDHLRASGRFSVTHAEGGSGVLVGWFHHDSRGWRTPNSLVFRIDGEANSFRVFFEYGTATWKTGGGQTFEGEYQSSRTSLIPADGRPHDFVLEYDPEGAGGRGEMRFTLDGETHRASLASGHREEGASLDRFGILNQQTSGDALTLWLDDLEIDGRRESFSEDPSWEARGARASFTDRVVRGRHDFGYRDSARAGGKPGELGGYLWRVESTRPEAAAYYGAPVGRLSLRDHLRASGKFSLHHGSADSALLLGWFNARTAIGAPPQNFVGLLVEGPSRVGNYFRPVYASSAGNSALAASGPLIRPDRASHDWTLDYDPGAGESGRITVGLDGEEVTLDLGPDARRADATFDRFGVVSWQRGGHVVEFYCDDLSYTARLPWYLVEDRQWTASRIRGRPEPPHPYRTERRYPAIVFDNPVVIGSAPGGDRIYVAEQHGRIYSFPYGRDEGPADLLVDLKKHVPTLTNVYGLTFHPDFEKNRFAFVCYTRGGDPAAGTVVSRFRVEPGEPPRLDAASERRLISWLAGGHNGGCLKFGPDGHLYIATGDGAGPYPPDGLDTGQDNSDLLSAILRIDVDVPEGGPIYRIPPDNPFVDMARVRPEIWAYGFRNPWKMSFDATTGELWVGDVGWELFEMVYRVVRGGNYGWSVTEGRHPIHVEGRRGPTPILPPVVEHSHSEARSITGGLVYRGPSLGELRGAYIYGDFDTRRIWALRLDGEEPRSHRELAETRVRIVAFGESPDHELLVLDYDAGTIHALVRNTDRDASADFPRLLSRTGLFARLPELLPEEGVVPYRIVAEPWLDGATAERHVALPGDSRIRFQGGSIVAPEGAVLVRTLSLPPSLFVSGPQGERALPRRIETQILHREAETWRAYTYAWNDEQTDAELVEASGRNVAIPVRDPDAPGGSSRLRWRFGSRGECIVCHNFFTGTVLGFTRERLDRERRDAGIAQDQLEILQRAGVLAGVPTRKGRRRIAAGPAVSLDDEARTYLDINCSHCHQRNAGGSTLIDLRSRLDLSETRCVDLRPLQGGLGIDQARIVFPGDSSRSVLYCRMASKGPAHMPRLGSSRIDAEGLELVRRWIDGLGRDLAELPQLEETSRELENTQRRLCRVLRDGRQPRAAREESLRELLGTTSGALELLRLIDSRRVESDMTARAVQIALESPSPHVRDLYRRFVRDDCDAPGDTLGVGFAPSVVLELRGDAERGRTLYGAGDLARCRTCHGLPGTPGTLGPDLAAAIRQKNHDRAALLEAILEPSKAIDPAYRLHLVVTRDGQTYTGFLLERGEDTRLRDMEGREVRIPAAAIRVVLPQERSAMPELLLKDFTAQQAADLLEYLLSLNEG